MSQILDKAVPEMEIIEQEHPSEVIPRVDQILFNNPEDDPQEREAFVVPSQLSKGARRAKRRRSRSSSESTPMNADGTGNGATQTRQSSSSPSDDRRRSYSSSSSRAANRTQNPVIEMVKILIGGLLAIPIAYSLVLWGFQQDPLNVAPIIEKTSLGFLVPADLRAAAEDDASSPAASGDNLDGDKSDGKPADNDSLAVPSLDPDRILNSN